MGDGEQGERGNGMLGLERKGWNEGFCILGRIGVYIRRKDSDPVDLDRNRIPGGRPLQ